MLHMIKLTVGCQNIDDLRQWLKVERINNIAFVRTRTTPKRAEEILQGGSLYRVMNGFITCRQPIIGFEPYQREDGHQGTLILVTDEVIAVEPRPMRPFQGWRYFKHEDIPADLPLQHQNTPILEKEFPLSLRKKLSELGIF